jgi:hypothetical protein
MNPLSGRRAGNLTLGKYATREYANRQWRLMNPSSSRRAGNLTLGNTPIGNRQSAIGNDLVFTCAGGELAGVVLFTTAGAGIGGSAAGMRVWTTTLVAHLRSETADAVLVQ